MTQSTPEMNGLGEKVYGVRMIGAGTRRGWFYVQFNKKRGKHDHFLSSSDVKEVMGENVRRWCVLRPDVLLTNQQALRWSLTTDDDENDGDEWTIKAVMLTNKNGDKDKIGNEFKYYGLDADTNKWWEIKFGTMMDVQLQDPVSITQFPSDVMVYHPKQDPIHLRLDNIDEWCTQHVGKSYLIHRPGNRFTSTTPSSLSTNIQVKCRSYNNGCMIASLCNLLITAGFSNLCEDAVELQPDEGSCFRRIGSMADKFTRVNGTIRFPHQKWTLDELCSKNSGLYLVRVKGSRGVDHCICIDGSRRIIIDSFSPECIKLSHEGLKLCVGDRSMFQGILEVCMFHVTSVSVERKRNCTSSHRRRQKRKRERENKVSGSSSHFK